MKESNRETGVILIVLAMAILILVGLCALALGLGFVATNRTRLQNITNLAALGAIEEYLRNSNNPVVAAAQAIVRANSILSQNKIPGTQSALGGLDDNNPSPTGGPGGLIEFGTWFVEDPANTGSTTTGICVNPPRPPGEFHYPCFMETSQNGGNPVNAVRILAKNQSGNFITASFGRVFGQERFYISTESIASLVPRCTVFLLDVSTSAISNSHILAGGGAGALFAFRLLSPGPGDTALWGLLPAIRGSNLYSYPQHYKDDYVVSPSHYGQVLIDKYVDDPAQQPNGYRGPEPLTSFMLAFNAGLRKLDSQITSGDGAALVAVAGGLRGRPEPVAGLSNDLSMLIQLTNMDNRGTYSRDAGGALMPGAPELHPNFVDRGWIPLDPSPGTDPDSDNTHLILGLQTAINRLRAPFCPAGAKKAIIVATDGLVSCGEDLTTCDESAGGGFAIYQDAKLHILGPILDEIKSEKIILTTILDGPNVGPYFMNRQRTDWTPGPLNDPDDPRFVDLVDAISHPNGAPYFFLSPDPSYNQPGFDGASPAAPFRDPSAFWGQVSMESGGLFCPLLDLRLDPITGLPSGYIDHDNDNSGSCAPCVHPAPPCTPCILDENHRSVNGMQTEATTLLSRPEQAALCAQLTVGLNPFILVEEQ